MTRVRRSQVLVIFLAVAGISKAEDAVEPYRAEMGLTGAWSSTNSEARALITPLLDELRVDREYFLEGDRGQDQATLEFIAENCGRVLQALPPSPPDDQLLQRSVSEVGNSLGILASFGAPSQAASLGGRLRAVTSGVAGANPENAAARALASAVRRKTERLYR